MGLLRWIRDVIADTGENEPVPIDLEREEGGEYVFRLGVRAGFGGGETARIMIQTRPNPANHPVLKEIHECEVAGQRLQAANMYALRDKVGRLLEAIAPARTLPLCYFRAPAMDYELPVYEDKGALVSPVFGAATLKARDFAGIRRVVCRYLVSAGYVGEPDEVAVGVVRPRDLRRVPPAAVFRSQTDEDFWLPSVEGVSAQGPVVGVVARPAELRARRRRRVGPAVEDHAPAAPDIVALLRYLRTELRQVRSEAAEGLFATEVRPEIWAAAEARTRDPGVRLVAHLADEEGTRLELAVRSTGAGEVAVALEDLGINVFMADDAEGLAEQVGHRLVRDGFLRFVEEVEVQAADALRAERLGVEEIRSDEVEPALWPLAGSLDPGAIRTWEGDWAAPTPGDEPAGGVPPPDRAPVEDEEVHAQWR